MIRTLSPSTPQKFVATTSIGSVSVPASTTTEAAGEASVTPESRQAPVVSRAVNGRRKDMRAPEALASATGARCPDRLHALKSKDVTVDDASGWSWQGARVRHVSLVLPAPLAPLRDVRGAPRCATAQPLTWITKGPPWGLWTPPFGAVTVDGTFRHSGPTTWRTHEVDPTRVVTVIGAALVLMIGGAVAYASIPATDGTITGCVLKSSGHVRIIDTATESCKSTETTVPWNQAGQPGEDGADAPDFSTQLYRAKGGYRGCHPRRRRMAVVLLL